MSKRERVKCVSERERKKEKGESVSLIERGKCV